MAAAHAFRHSAASFASRAFCVPVQVPREAQMLSRPSQSGVVALGDSLCSRNLIRTS